MAAVATYTACLIPELNILLMGTLSQEYEHNAVMQFWLLFHGSRAHMYTKHSGSDLKIVRSGHLS